MKPPKRDSVWKTVLRDAVDNGEILVYYQPKIEVATGKITGMEALIRWQREGRLVSPLDFIPLAEDTGLIVPIGRWVLEESCRQVLHWRNHGHPDLRVAVNLSARQVQDPGLVQTVEEVLESTGLKASALELEVTESLMMSGVALAEQVLGQLSALGVSIALDDFGTGYSSLSYLRRFPINALKIDKSFVEDLPHDPDAAAVVRTITLHGPQPEIGGYSRRGGRKESSWSFLKGPGLPLDAGLLFQPSGTGGPVHQTAGRDGLKSSAVEHAARWGKRA